MHYGIYLTLDPCYAAGTGLWVTENSAIAAAVLPGYADGPKFMFLLHVNFLYPRGAQQCPTLFGGERLQKEVLVYFCVVEIDVVIRDVLSCERVGLLRLHCAILSQLKRRWEHIQELSELGHSMPAYLNLPVYVVDFLGKKLIMIM